MIIVPVKEGENIEKALCTEAPEDGTRYLRTEASCNRRVKKVRVFFGSFKIIS